MATNLKDIQIGGKTIKVNPLIADRLVAANQEFKSKTGKDFQIAAAYRSPEQQESIRKSFGYTSDSQQSGVLGLPKAAPPGKSFHQSGDAVDVSNWNEAEPYLRKYQLKNDVSNDKGHFSVGETSKMKYANLADRIVEARKKGKSDTEIVDKFVQALPEFKNAVMQAKQQGKNDSEIINRMALIYSGVGRLPVASNPVPQGYKGNIQKEQENKSLAEKRGFDFIPGQGVVPKKQESNISKLNLKENLLGPLKDFGKSWMKSVGMFNKMSGSENPIERSAAPAVGAVNLIGDVIGGTFGEVGGLVKTLGNITKQNLDFYAPEKSKELSKTIEDVKKTVTPVAVEAIKQMGIGVPGIGGLKIDASTLVKKWGEFSQQHPDVAHTIGNALNVSLWEFGGEAAGTAEKGAGKGFAEELSSSADKALEKGITKGIKPGIANMRMSGYIDKAKSAIKTMVGNTHLVNVLDSAGEKIVQYSKADNFLGAVKDGFEQTKGKIFSAYDNLKRISGETGGQLNLKPIADEVRSFAENNTVMKVEHPETYDKFIKAAESLEKQGTYTLDQGQESIKQANEILKTFYRTGTGSADKDVKAFISSRLRQAMDSVITGETDQSYQALKNAYGSFSAMDRDLMNMVSRNAKKAPKGLYDVFGDMAASGELLRGIVTMNPGDIATGFGIKAVKEFYKNMNSDIEILKKAFKAVEGEITPGGGIIEEGLKAKPKPKPILQLPAPKEGASTKEIMGGSPINLPAKTTTAIDAADAARAKSANLGKKIEGITKPSGILGLPSGEGKVGGNVIELPAQGKTGIKPLEKIKGVFKDLKNNQSGFAKLPGKEPLSFIKDATKYKTPEEFINKNTVTVYHSTDKVFKDFNPELGDVWFTDDKSAITDPSKGVGASGKGQIMERVLPKNLKLATPEQMDKYYTDQLIQMGYDGVYYPGLESEGTGNFYQIFNTKNIKTKNELLNIWNKSIKK